MNDNKIIDFRWKQIVKNIEACDAEYATLRPRLAAMAESSGRRAYCFVMEAILQIGRVGPALGLPLKMVIDQMCGVWEGGAANNHSDVLEELLRDWAESDRAFKLIAAL